MDASKSASNLRWQDRRRRRVDPATASATVKRPRRKRPGCTDIARSRAARYARRRRIAKLFRPLIAAFILVGLIFERRPPPAFPWSGKRPVDDGDTMHRSPDPEPETRHDTDPLPDPGDAGGAIRGDPEPRYLPPADFLATRKEVIQIVAFLIRNKGKLDTDPIRMKWETLDRASLPLAVFLREIEANVAWDDLEDEIAAARFDIPAAPGMGLPKSPRHRKILQLLPEWTRRGEGILSPEPAGDDSPATTPTIDDDPDPDRKPPKP
jgi:hypothetical protein